MAKSREEVQDIALYHMDKMNRNSQGQRVVKIRSLEEEVKEMERWNSLTPEQRLQDRPFSEYSRGLREWMSSREGRKHGIFTERFYGWLGAKHAKELEEHHSKGTQYKDLAPWLREKADIHLNL